MKNRFINIFLILIFNLFFFSYSMAEEFNFNVTELQITENGNIITGINGGVVTTRNDEIIITAENFKYNKLTSLLEAEGNVKLVDKIAFNYSKKESNTITYNTSELENYLTENNIQNIKVISTTNNNLRNTIKEQQTGKEFWKLALLLSLVFFAIEILLIKLIKL